MIKLITRGFTTKFASTGAAAVVGTESKERGVHYVYTDVKGDIPNSVKAHRQMLGHKKPADIEAYRRQLLYHCRNIGTQVLEIVLRDYLTLHGPNMTYAELEQFDADILDVENP